MKNAACVRPREWDGGHLPISFLFPAKLENLMETVNSPSEDRQMTFGDCRPLAETVSELPLIFRALAETVRVHAEIVKALPEIVIGLPVIVRGHPEVFKALPESYRCRAEVFRVLPAPSLLIGRFQCNC